MKKKIWVLKKCFLIALLALGIVAFAKEKNTNQNNLSDEGDSNIEVDSQEYGKAKEETNYSKAVNLNERIDIKNSKVDFRYMEKDILEDVDEVTLEELISLVIEASNTDYTRPEVKDIEKTIIDCGNDGVKEQCVRIPFSCAGNYYEVICILNEEDGKKSLQYMTDEGQEDQVMITEDGFIETQMPTDYGMCIENSYLDSNFEKHYNYTMKYYLSADKYDKIHTSGGEWSDIQVQEYDFGDGKYYCCYFMLDENNQAINENDDAYKYVFEKAGLIVLSEEDIEIKIAKQIS